MNVLFDEHPFPIIVYDLLEFNIIAVDKTALVKYKFSKSEFLKKKIVDLHPTRELKKLKGHLKSIEKYNGVTQEWKHINAIGNTFDVIVKGSSIVYNNRKARLAVVEDMTQKKKAEKEREKQNRKYQDLIESSSDII